MLYKTNCMSRVLSRLLIFTVTDKPNLRRTKAKQHFNPFLRSFLCKWTLKLPTTHFYSSLGTRQRRSKMNKILACRPHEDLTSRVLQESILFPFSFSILFSFFFSVPTRQQESAERKITGPFYEIKRLGPLGCCPRNKRVLY